MLILVKHGQRFWVHGSLMVDLQQHLALVVDGLLL
jgi:hypothetical protein